MVCGVSAITFGGCTKLESTAPSSFGDSLQMFAPFDASGVNLLRAKKHNREQNRARSYSSLKRNRGNVACDQSGPRMRIAVESEPHPEIANQVESCRCRQTSEGKASDGEALLQDPASHGD